MKIGDLEGESTDEEFLKFIEVLSFHWGVSQVPPPHGVAAGKRLASALDNAVASGRTNLNDFSFVKPVDKSSSELLNAVCSGQPFSDASFVARLAPSGGPTILATGDVYLKITMTDVLISSVSPGADAVTDDRALEAVSLTFSKVEFEHIAQDGETTPGSC